jgi:hypothetical protein
MDSGKDIYCGDKYGPCFSGDRRVVELGAWELFKGKEHCLSWPNKDGYEIPLVDGKNQLTNQVDGPFTISELEVWLVED